jgi:hypothetical protein
MRASSFGSKPALQASRSKRRFVRTTFVRDGKNTSGIDRKRLFADGRFDAIASQHATMSIEALKRTWIRFWREPVRGERLALVRIAFAATLLADLLFQYLPNLSVFFGPEGYAPAGVNDDYLLRTWRWPALFFNTDDMTVIAVAFFAWVAATVSLLVGYQTRVSSLLVWFGTMCFFARNPNLKNGGDDTLQIALFLLMLTPCGAALSVDAWRRRRRGMPYDRSIAPWGVRLFQLQLCIIYLTTGIAKLRGHSWIDGTAIHYVINDVTMARWSYAQLPLPFWITATLTYATLSWEVLFPLLVLWRRTRAWALWFGVMLHLGIYLMIEVGWFSFYMIAMYAVWIPDRWWESRRGR